MGCVSLSTLYQCYKSKFRSDFGKQQRFGTVSSSTSALNTLFQGHIASFSPLNCEKHILAPRAPQATVLIRFLKTKVF